MTSSNPNHPEGPTSDHHRAAGRGPPDYARGEGTNPACAHLAILTWVAGLPGAFRFPFGSSEYPKLCSDRVLFFKLQQENRRPSVSRGFVTWGNSGRRPSSVGVEAMTGGRAGLPTASCPSWCSDAQQPPAPAAHRPAPAAADQAQPTPGSPTAPRPSSLDSAR